MATHGKLGEFDQRTGDWKSYIKRLEQYFVANDVVDAAEGYFDQLCGGSHLLYPQGCPISPTEADFKTIVDKMTEHFKPAPLPFPHPSSPVPRIRRYLHCTAQADL